MRDLKIEELENVYGAGGKGRRRRKGGRRGRGRGRSVSRTAVTVSRDSGRTVSRS